MKYSVSTVISRFFPPLLLIIFILLSLSCIRDIGLTYDEAMFIKGIFYLPAEPIYKYFFSIPFMILPDQGAIKTYLFYPIFKLFDVNIFSIRLPTILIAATTLIIWFKITRRMFLSIFFPLIFLALLATDPAYIFHTRVDFGPVALEAFFAAVTIYCYLLFLDKKSLLYLAISCVAILLGLLNKINFLEFCLPFIYVAFLYDKRRIFPILHQQRTRSYLLLGFFFTLVAMIVIFLIIPPALHYPMGGMTKVPLSQKIPYIFRLFLTTFDSSFRYQMIFNERLKFSDVTVWIELITSSIGVLLLLYLKLCKIKNNVLDHYKQYLLFYLVLFILQFLFILFTPHTFATNHIMLLWPLNHLVFILSLAMLVALFKRPTLKIITSLSIVLCVVFCSQIYINFQYINAFKDATISKFYIWSPVIFNLNQYVSEHSGEYDNIISDVAGPHTPLLALAKNNDVRTKLHEAWFLFTDISFIQECVHMHPLFNHDTNINQEWLYKNYFAGKKNLIITRSNGETFHNEKDGFFDFAEKHHIAIKSVTTLSDDAGQSIYTLYSAQMISKS